MQSAVGKVPFAPGQPGRRTPTAASYPLLSISWSPFFVRQMPRRAISFRMEPWTSLPPPSRKALQENRVISGSTHRRWRDRLPVMAAVSAAHLLGFWALILVVRLPSAPSTSLEVPAVLTFFEPQQPQNLRPQAHAGADRARQRRALHQRTPRAPVSEGPGAPPKIDWAEEATTAVSQEIHRGELAAQQRDALSPKRSSAFSSAQPLSKFHWDYASTHRIEPLGPSGTAIHLNDKCVIVIFLVPMIGCAIDDMPARGDLFEHMRDKAAEAEWSRH